MRLEQAGDGLEGGQPLMAGYVSASTPSMWSKALPRLKGKGNRYVRANKQSRSSATTGQASTAAGSSSKQEEE
jgi:hypothetical protein